MAKPQQRRAAPPPGTALGQGVKKPVAKGKKIRSVKNEIRGVERLLKKADLDPKVRAKKEAELQQLRKRQEANQQAEVERKNAVRYHKVRFFERVKVERAIAKLERRKLQAGVLTEQEQQQARQLQEDLLYILHFPKAEKYVSLLKTPEDAAERARVEAERARLRRAVAARLRDSAAVTEADEGRALDAVLSQPSATIKPAADSRRGQAAATAVRGSGTGGKKAAASLPAPAVTAAAVAVPESDEEDDFFLSSGDEDDAAERSSGEGQQQQQHRLLLGVPVKAAPHITRAAAVEEQPLGVSSRKRKERGTAAAGAEPGSKKPAVAAHGAADATANGARLHSRSGASPHAAAAAAATAESDDDFFLDADGGAVDDGRGSRLPHASRAQARRLHASSSNSSSNSDDEDDDKVRTTSRAVPRQQQHGTGYTAGQQSHIVGKRHWETQAPEDGRTRKASMGVFGKRIPNAGGNAAPATRPAGKQWAAVGNHDHGEAGRDKRRHKARAPAGRSQKAAPVKDKTPLRKRAEGGRKRKHKRKGE